MLPKTSPQITAGPWNSAIATLPGAHVLQTWEWGKVKSQFGWQPHYLLWCRREGKIELVSNKLPAEVHTGGLAAAALVLHRKIMLGGFAHKMGVMYVPKGPLLDWNDDTLSHQVLQDLEKFTQMHSAIFVKIDPDVELGTGALGIENADESPLGKHVLTQLQSLGWHFSESQVQFRNTVLIDLNPNEKDLLANMKQKTRYNINLASRKGVNVRLGSSDDLSALYKMYAETSVRDGFVIRHEAYYHELWSTFLRTQETFLPDQPAADALVAEVEGEPVAAAIILRFAGKAWYMYGMSTTRHRDKMPNYLLQWEAVKRLKAARCTTYDLWGAPDEFVESDPLWGVYRFKEGLGGTVHRYLGAWDLPVNRMLYQLYSKTLPGLMDIMRKRGKASTKQVLG